ncbi:MAG: signal peptidase II [Coriobacteriia bacterium]|jgi:signal peptidase II|nr:signal peptidase II [Coriobacteriia bacterium]MDR2714849.1 signal peptidase II [Coriobacteriales bacterium]
MKKRFLRSTSVVLFVALVAALLLADRITKILAVEHLSDGKAIAFIPHVLDFVLVFNKGAAFGMMEGATLLFTVIAFAVSFGLLLYLLLTKSHAVLELLGISLIAAGALGNAIDRIRFGEVTDFIHTLFIEFPVFNVADSCVTVGAILLAFYILGSEFFKPAASSKVEAKVSAKASSTSSSTPKEDSDA